MSRMANTTILPMIPVVLRVLRSLTSSYVDTRGDRLCTDAEDAAKLLKAFIHSPTSF